MDRRLREEYQQLSAAMRQLEIAALETKARILLGDASQGELDRTNAQLEGAAARRRELGAILSGRKSNRKRREDG